MTTILSSQSRVTIHETYVEKQFYKLAFYSRESVWYDRLKRASIPHIPTAIAFDQHRRRIQYVRCGNDLLHIDRFNTFERWNIVFGITEHLIALHGMGAMHGDLKLENVLYCHDTKRIQVIDYVTMQRCSAASTNAIIGGTLEYFALEQHQRRVCLATDVWAFGILISEFFFGSCHFLYDDHLAILGDINIRIHKKSIENIKHIFGRISYWQGKKNNKMEPWACELQTLLSQMLSIDHMKRPDMTTVQTKLLRTQRIWYDTFQHEPIQNEPTCKCIESCVLL